MIMSICWLHLHYVNLPFHQIPNVPYWINDWRLWRPLVCSELTVMLIGGWVHCGRKKMDMMDTDGWTQVGCGV